MPGPCCDDEEHEDEDLEYESSEDDVLAHLHVIFIFCLDQHASSARLDKEADDVPGNEDCSDPACSHHGQRSGVGARDEPSEGHVDGGGEENGRDEDQNALDDIRRLGLGVFRSCGPGCVANRLELLGVRLAMGTV